MSNLTSIELCAGAGGQALGLEQAGFDHVALVEVDWNCCKTLKLNRPAWNVIRADLQHFDGSRLRGCIDILAGGLPCPPFSIAGKQLGENDERNLFPSAIHLIDQIQPKAVMIENVRGILGAVFEDYRTWIAGQLSKLGYETGWSLLNASDFGVPQLRPRVSFVAIRKEFSGNFSWPLGMNRVPPSVGETLHDLMAAKGWKGAAIWSKRANDIAPTIVGGSHKHGGPDLGPTRARNAWASLGVNGKSIAVEAPGPDFVGMPRLTVRMVARIQGFPDEWGFSGSKTAAYKQVGNAFPPPVACAVAERIKACLTVRQLHAVSA